MSPIVAQAPGVSVLARKGQAHVLCSANPLLFIGCIKPLRLAQIQGCRLLMVEKVQHFQSSVMSRSVVWSI